MMVSDIVVIGASDSALVLTMCTLQMFVLLLLLLLLLFYFRSTICLINGYSEQ